MPVNDPSISQAYDPNAGGQTTQVTPSTSTGFSTGQTYQGSLATGYNNTPTYSTSYQPAPGTGSAPAAPQQPSYAPMDVGYNGNVPGTGENVSAAFLNHYATNGMPQVSNDAEQQYQQFNASTPADMSSYYDNAQRLSDNAINTQMAARGSYGSSNAIGQLSNADTNLRAQQARDEAQYGLQRAQTGGSLASAADSSSGAQSNNERNWMGALSDLGFANQKEGAARYEMGNADMLTGANIGSGIENTQGNQEIDQQQQLLIQQLMAQGMSASDAATAAHNASAATDASDANAAQNIQSGVTAAALLV